MSFVLERTGHGVDLIVTSGSASRVPPSEPGGGVSEGRGAARDLDDEGVRVIVGCFERYAVKAVENHGCQPPDALVAIHKSTCLLYTSPSPRD